VRADLRASSPASPQDHRILYGLLYLSAIALGGVLAFVPRAPAALAGWLLEAASAGALKMERPSGTLWAGTADFAIRAGTQRFTIQNVSWVLEPGTLWRGELAARLSSTGPNLTGALEAGGSASDLWVRNAKLEIAAGPLLSQIPGLSLYGPTGRLVIRSTALSLRPPAVSGSAALLLEHAQSRRLGALGDYQVALEGENGGVQIRLTTLHGPLRLSGEGELTLGGQLRFHGSAIADEASRATLNPVLYYIGRPGPDGAVPLNWPLSGPAAGQRLSSALTPARPTPQDPIHG
jgi:hypothetical protein